MANSHPQEVPTSILLKQLMESTSIESFVEKNRPHLLEGTAADYLCAKCEEKNLVRERVILAAGIDRSYGHQIFRGIRSPSRDKWLLLALSMKLTLEETQQLLLLAGKSRLHAKIMRDDVILFALARGLTLLEVEEMLQGLHLPLLGDDIF